MQWGPLPGCHTVGHYGRRKPDIETASPSRLAFHADCSIMIQHDFANGCETKSGAGQARGKERLENSPRHPLIEAASIITDGDANIAARRECNIADLAWIDHVFPFCGHMNNAAIVNRLRGIGTEIEDDLLQLRWFARYGHVIRDVINDQPDVGSQRNSQK